MFTEKGNSGYWSLGKDTVQLITQWLEDAHAHRAQVFQSQHAESQEKQDMADDQDLRDRKKRSQQAQERVEEELGPDASRDEL